MSFELSAFLNADFSKLEENTEYSQRVEFQMLSFTIIGILIRDST